MAKNLFPLNQPLVHTYERGYLVRSALHFIIVCFLREHCITFLRATGLVFMKYFFDIYTIVSRFSDHNS